MRNKVKLKTIKKISIKLVQSFPTHIDAENVRQSLTIEPNNKYPNCAYAKNTIINITLKPNTSFAHRDNVADNCVIVLLNETYLKI